MVHQSTKLKGKDAAIQDTMLPVQKITTFSFYGVVIRL